MDPKSWWNIGINIFSFSIKTTTWIFILSIYDKKMEEEMGKSKYIDKLWDEEDRWFLFDYLAAYIIKMSIYVFIFEMKKI